METQANAQLISYCGLYCGNCRSFKSGKCPGCAKNEKASWCKIRSCCMKNNYANCSECTSTNAKDCPKHNHVISKLFGLIFKSDRPASIRYIKENGAENYAQRMTELNQMVIKRKDPNFN